MNDITNVYILSGQVVDIVVDIFEEEQGGLCVLGGVRQGKRPER